MAYKIKPFCLGCHYCALECPTHAIDYVGTQYQIDLDKCVECGKCVEVCNVSAIDTGKPEVVMPHAPKELEADCVVIGAGAGRAHRQEDHRAGKGKALRRQRLVCQLYDLQRRDPWPRRTRRPRWRPGRPGGRPRGPSHARQELP